MLAAAGPAAAAPAPVAPLADALARDLGLTVEQARGLLTAQNEAAEVDAAAMEIESYAGSAFDVRTHVLTVRVTDEAAVAAVEALGAEAEVVDTAPDEVIQALNAAETPEGVVGWYPDGDGVVVEVLPGSGVTAADLDVPDEAVRVVEAEQPSTYGRIIGGHRFTVNGGRCTIGFSARGGGSVEGFLTAGHCGRVGDVLQGPNGPVGVFRHSVFPGSDGAFVQVSPPWVVTDLVERYSTTYLQVTGSTPAPVGSAVCLSSPAYGWQCGTLLARNQTVSYPQGAVRGLFRTNLCSGPGDSGAPIVAGSQAQGIVSGGSGSPGAGCTTFGQEIDPLLSMWGLTLVTS
jgi:streptogrisin C